MKKVLLLALPVLAAATLFGSVTAAQASPISRANVTAAQGSPISRANATRMAKSYLSFKAFSFKGMVKQLKYEGFATSDATYGASHSGANWMKQAVRMAKSYLRLQAFSRNGLIEQLKYEGFTHSQALHGARGAGL
jgi:Host cell surface-exposed lipoprotein